MLEDALRETLSDQARTAPPVHDPATVAIRRADRRRKRRLAAGALATVMVLTGMLVGLQSLRDYWQPSAGDSVAVGPALLPPERAVPAPVSTSPPDTGDVGMDIRVINAVWTPQGERFLLTGSSIVEHALRTPYGLLYGNDREIRLRRGTSALALAQDVGRWVASADGGLVGFVADGRAQVVAATGEETDGTARAGDAEAAVPEGTEAVAFWDDRLVLSGPDGYDVWDPSRPYVPTWTDEVLATYGASGGGLLVLVEHAGEHCLATVPVGEPTLRPDPASRICDVPVGDDRAGWLSPDGAWLAVPAAGQLQLLPTATRTDAQPVSCPRRSDVAPVWRDTTTLLTADASGAVSCEVTGDVQRLSLPERITVKWQFVPRATDVPAGD